MKPTVITFVDDKMLSYAEEQAENVRQFGLDHKIFRLHDVVTYDPALWMRMFDLTVDSLNEYGKIFRLDAEVRLHKPLPQSWLDNDNVFFQPYPYSKRPYYTMNTGQIIIGRSGLEFCRMFRECMLAMVPPNSKLTDMDFYFDDEYPGNFALRLSGVEYVQEYLQMDRLDTKKCSANRGSWVEESTILTHPTIHNWSYNGAGLFPNDKLVDRRIVINHFDGDLNLARFIIELVLEKNTGPIWNKIATNIGDGWYMAGGWYFNPATSFCSPTEHWPNTRKLVHAVTSDESQSTNHNNDLIRSLDHISDHNSKAV